MIVHRFIYFGVVGPPYIRICLSLAKYICQQPAGSSYFIFLLIRLAFLLVVFLFETAHFVYLKVWTNFEYVLFWMNGDFVVYIESKIKMDFVTT